MELPMRVTRITTIGELVSCKKGRDYVQKLMNRMGMGQQKDGDDAQKVQEEKNKRTDAAMGAGSEKMRQQMMFEMPLNALVSYGIMEDAALEKMIADLNTETA